MGCAESSRLCDNWGTVSSGLKSAMSVCNSGTSSGKIASSEGSTVRATSMSKASSGGVVSFSAFGGDGSGAGAERFLDILGTVQSFICKLNLVSNRRTC